MIGLALVFATFIHEKDMEGEEVEAKNVEFLEEGTIVQHYTYYM